MLPWWFFGHLFSRVKRSFIVVFTLSVVQCCFAFQRSMGRVGKDVHCPRWSHCQAYSKRNNCIENYSCGSFIAVSQGFHGSVECRLPRETHKQAKHCYRST